VGCVCVCVWCVCGVCVCVWCVCVCVCVVCVCVYVCVCVWGGGGGGVFIAIFLKKLVKDQKGYSTANPHFINDNRKYYKLSAYTLEMINGRVSSS